MMIQVQKGSLVEVLSGGEWWDAEVTKLKGGQARVHYVGGADDEDEWIPISRSILCIGISFVVLFVIKQDSLAKPV